MSVVDYHRSKDVFVLKSELYTKKEFLDRMNIYSNLITDKVDVIEIIIKIKV